MLSPKNALGIFFYVNIISWLLLLIINLIAFIGYENYPVFSINFYLKGLLLNFFFLIIFFYFKARIERVAQQQPDFIGLLTSLFITGLITNTAALIIQFISDTILEVPPITAVKTNWINILYHLNIGLVSIFLTQAFFHWKKLILYQKSNKLAKIWNTFEYLLLSSLLFNFFELEPTQPLFAIPLVALMIVGLVLSANLRWVAYLNAKEKWQGILLLIFLAVFTFYFFRTVITHAYNPYLTTDLTHSIYILTIGSFVMFYSVFSILVIIFNLPTSSVFERKAEDILNFQKLAQSLQAGENENEVYEVLLESAINTVQADAALLEILDEEGRVLHAIPKNLSPQAMQYIKQLYKKQKFNQILNETFARPAKQKENIDEKLEAFGYGSLHTAKLIGHELPLGSLVLLKEVKDAFDTEKRELLNTFAMQASVSIENFRLIAKTIETERYKEEAKIARNVQKQLLPKNLAVNPKLELAAFSQSAYEVGGDYYDLYKVNEDKVIFIVGDVSGKGSNAAFNMAQMKGIFQGIAPLNPSPKDFLNNINQALAECLTPNSFITATLMYVDTKQQIVEIVRAGHCPTYHYSNALRSLQTLQGKGMGLGIIKHQGYSQYIETQSFEYQKHDIIVLYTDGIVEARDRKGNEYGYERLEKLIKKYYQHTAQEISNFILEDLRKYSESSKTIDDYTALIIKFV